MKKLVYKLLSLSVSVLFIFITACGGGSGGNASITSPDPTPSGTVHSLVLTTEKNTAQTGSYVYFYATLLDGNGNGVPDKSVTFMNVAGDNVIVAANTAGLNAKGVTTAVTNSNGIATVRTKLVSEGFTTIVAEADGYRDKRSVWFTSSNSAKGFSFTPVVIDVDIDGNNNGIYNEPDDLKVCQNAADGTVKIRATVWTAGARTYGTTVNFSTDSDKTSTFPYTPYGKDNDGDGDKDTDSVTTNYQGEAFTELSINCLVENVERILNVYATTPATYVPEFDGRFSGAGGISLFLQPVTITAVKVTAVPDIVLSTETSVIKAAVETTAGNELNDILVNFKTSCGTVDPALKATEHGISETKFSPPAYPGDCTITARAGGVTGTAVVKVTLPLSVTPESVNVSGTSGGTAAFTINGGFPGYTITRDNAAAWSAPSPATVTSMGGSFSVTVPAGTPAGSVKYTIRDSRGTTVTATLTITAGTSLGVMPATQTVAAGIGNSVTYTILGGSAPFTAFSGNPAVVTVSVSGATLTATVASVPAADTTVTLTVYDSTGKTASASLVVDVP